MTAHVHTTIRCEHTTCTAAYAADGWPGDVRAAAKRAGWDTTGTDRCPTHPISGDEPPPTLFDVP